jgi:hypothetical protein
VLVALALLQARLALDVSAQRDLLVAGVVFFAALVTLKSAPSVAVRIVGGLVALVAMSGPRLVPTPAVLAGAPWDRIGWAVATAAVAVVGLARYLAHPEPYVTTPTSAWDALRQRHLPPPLRVGPLATLTFAGIVAAGCLWTLPPGPLADEGMVLFMEGGCDWGASNVFFFAKAGLVVAVGAVYAMALRYRIRHWLPFTAHYGLGAALVAAFFSDPRCDAYWYGHPQGSIGQMVVETQALGVLALVTARAVAARSLPVGGQLAAGAAVPLAYAAAFQLWLPVVPHWTWGHTGLIVAALLALAAGVSAAAHKSLARSPSPA